MNRFMMGLVVLSGVLMVAISGCRSRTPPVTWYMLNAMPAGPASLGEVDGKATRTIGILPIDLPGQINRIQMVKRTGQNQLEVAPFHRWAEYPDRMVQQVIGTNLQILMADERIYSAPWPAGLQPDVTVDVTFFELIGTTDKMMRLSAVWTIIESLDASTARTHQAALTEPIFGLGFDDLAAAHSQALEAFCREVAESLHAFVQ